MEHKSFHGHATVKAQPEGIAEIVVSAYGNLDEDRDIVLPGATAKQLAGGYGPNRPKGLLDHDRSMRSAVAKTLDWWEADDGVHIKAQYNLDKQAGREAFSDLLFYGDDMEFSVGYSVKATAEPTIEQKQAGARRVISEWAINEWSHVWLGANHATGTVSAKGQPANGKAIDGSYEQVSDRLREALQTGTTGYVWIRGTLPDRVVFERSGESADGTARTGTFEATYEITADGITVGEPVEVTVSEIVQPKAAKPTDDDDVKAITDGRRRQFQHLVATTRF